MYASPSLLQPLLTKSLRRLPPRVRGAPVVVVGAAGGKERPQAVEAGDLAQVTHDPLLAALRQRLRRAGAVPRGAQSGLACVYSREPVRLPDAGSDACAVDGSLNCHGYGSSVTVTATFGMVAASEALRLVRGRGDATPLL